VHDRTAVPLVGETPEMAAEWAQKSGADGLIITGASFADTLARIGRARAAGIRRPVLIGGSVTTENVAQALDTDHGVIVSTCLMRDGTPEAGDPRKWDQDKTHRFMDAARGRRS
jgi:predicted TIM-barrel enzyme